MPPVEGAPLHVALIGMRFVFHGAYGFSGYLSPKFLVLSRWKFRLLEDNQISNLPADIFADTVSLETL